MMLTAFLIDQIGSWAYNVVLIVYVYDGTGSATWIAATTAAGWVPRILFSAYAGVLADRFERTRTLLVSAALPFAATIMTTSPVLGFVLQVVSGGGMVVVDVLAITALQRNMPRDLLSRAIGLLQTAALGASFAVAALIHELGLTDALLIVGFGFSAIAAAGLRPLSRTEHSTPGAAAIPEPPVTMRQDPVPTAPAAS
jgi:MFS family permease